jgi:hypothetical protein
MTSDIHYIRTTLSVRLKNLCSTIVVVIDVVLLIEGMDGLDVLLVIDDEPDDTDRLVNNGLVDVDDEVLVVDNGEAGPEAATVEHAVLFKLTN